jgi:acetolactate synthase I/II/III large subunit
VSVWCARAARPADVPALLDAAIAAATGPVPGPAVLLLAKDLQRAELGADLGAPRRWAQAPPRSAPDPAAIARAAALLASRPILVIAGDEVARDGARAELAALVERLDAVVAVTPDARDAFANDSPRFAGVAGTLGHPAVASIAADAAALVIAGTRLPVMARQGLDALLRARPTVSTGRCPPHVRCDAQHVHVEGALPAVRAALAARAPSSPPTSLRPPAPAPDAASGAVAAMRVLDRALPPGSVVIVDAGNTGAIAAHYLRAPRDGRWLIAMGMAGMGYAFGAAVGAACATGGRVTAVAGDGAFYMHGLDIHTAVEHQLPITYVLLDNRAHGMCLVRERLLLAEHAGYNAFGPVHLGAGLGAMFPRLAACDVATPAALADALARAYASDGPAVIAVALDEVEIPPHAAFAQALAGGARTVRREP